MARFDRVFPVSHAQYYLSEGGYLDYDGIMDMYTGFNGLISVTEYDHLAIIMTGTVYGSVSVCADWRDSEPPLETDGWDEVVEVSMLFEDDPGILDPVARPYDGGEIPGLEPGSYRIRLHARGRDRGEEEHTVSGAPVEHHLIQAWPADWSRETWFKLTDKVGSSIRAVSHVKTYFDR